MVLANDIKLNDDDYVGQQKCGHLKFKINKLLRNKFSLTAAINSMFRLNNFPILKFNGSCKFLNDKVERQFLSFSECIANFVAVC